MSSIISLLAHKGGVGKTTSAVILAHLLTLAGSRVLLVDLDVQGNVGDSLGLKHSDALFRFLVAEAGTLAIRETRIPGLDVILSGPKTVKVKRDLVNTASWERPEMRLKVALDGVASGYDVIVLDTAPGVDELQIAAIAASDGVLVPVDLSELAVRGAVQVVQLLSTLKARGVFAGRLLGVLPTMWDRVTRESALQIEAMADSGLRVWPPIPVDVRVREAARHGLTLVEYQPRTRAMVGVRLNGSGLVGGYVKVARELLEEL